MFPVKQSTAIDEVFFVHDANGDAVTGKVDGDFTKRISKNAAAFAAMTVTITERENGWYHLQLSTSHTDTLGVLSVTLTASGVKQVNLQWRVHARIPDDLCFPNTSGRGLDVETDGMAHADVKEWLAVAPNALVAGRVDSRPGDFLTGSIDADAIAANAIGSSELATDAIGSDQIAANAIGSAEIANDAITAAKIANGAIDAATFAANAIDSTAIAADAITSSKIQDGALTAAKFAAGAVMQPAVAGTADAGTTTTLDDAILTEGNDYWNGAWLVMTGGSNVGQARKISDFDAATDRITVDRAFGAAVASGHTYEIWPVDFPNNFSSLTLETDGMVHADVKEWLTAAPNALVAGAVDADVSAVQTGAIDANAIAANAIGASEIANGAIDAATFVAGAIDAAALNADAVNEIRDAILADSTPFNGASIATLVTNTTGLFKAVASGTATSGSTTTLTDTSRTESDTDYWKGSWLLITTGNIAGQARKISGYNFSTDTFTVDRAFTQPVATNQYEVHGADFPDNLSLLGIETDGMAHADLKEWLTAAPNTLVAGAVDADVSAVQTDAIDANAIAANAIGASEIANGAIDAATFAANAIDAAALAADAVAEIADAVADEDIVAAHGTADTLGRLVSELSRRTVTFNTDVVDGSILGQLADDGTATYDRTTDSVQAIRDRGDAAWTTGGGGSSPILLQNTTIATLASQTEFTLTAGSTDNDAYNGCIIVVTDQATSTQKAVGLISDYTGATRTVFLDEDPGVFLMATTDIVDVIAAPKQLPDVRHDAAGGLPTGDANGRIDLGSWLGSAPNALKAGAVDADVSAIQANAITAAAIASAAIDADAIAANAITAAKINAAAITATKFAAGAINAAAIATDAIDNTKIAADAIGSAEIANGAIDALTFAAGAIDAAAIGTGAIDADSIAANAITAAKIATDAITAAKIEAGAIGAAEIANGAIDAATFAAGAIDSSAIAAGAITAGTFATDAIDANALAADAVDELLVFKKNTAVPVFHFLMKDSATGDPKTGLTVTVNRAIDTGTFSAHGGTVTEIANGWYRTDFLAGDMNGDSIAFRFSAAGAKDLGIAVRTKP